MGDWAEVKKLAADFQRAQLSDAAQKLSDRNCREIINKLIHLDLIDVIYSTDGKDYITRTELGKEIREELEVHQGRINLVTLAQILLVDFSHIEEKTNELLKNDPGLQLVLGQIVDRSYIEHVCEEVNDKLQQVGCITIGELAKQYDLPADFIKQNLEDKVGTIIKASLEKFDSVVLYTDSYISRETARVRGVFSALTRPISLQSLMSRHVFQERLLLSILDRLIKAGRICGVVSGGNYIPSVYTRAQSEWVQTFYSQNGYIDYSTLTRLGVSDPAGYVKKNIKDVLLLHSSAVGPRIIEQLEAEVEEVMANASLADLQAILPSSLSQEDILALLEIILSKPANKGKAFAETIIVSEMYLKNLEVLFEEAMRERVEKESLAAAVIGDENVSIVLEKATHIPTSTGTTKGGNRGSGKKWEEEDDEEDAAKSKKKDDRRKKANVGKAGGGSQGRETKTKALKQKKNRGGKQAVEEREEEDNVDEVKKGEEFMLKEEIETIIKRERTELCHEYPEELLEALVNYMYTLLNKKYVSMLKQMRSEVSASSAHIRRKRHEDLQEQIISIVTQIKLIEKGISLIDDETARSHMIKHLLKSLGSDVLHACLVYLLPSVRPDTITPESRTGLIQQKLEEPVKAVVVKLNSAISSGKSLVEFYTQLDNVCALSVCEVMIKKADKKKDRQVVYSQRQALAQELQDGGQTGAELLHLVALILFMEYTGTTLGTMPGRFTPSILTLLREYTPVDEYQVLRDYQDMVMRAISSPEDEEVKGRLGEMKCRVRDIGLKLKRSQTSRDKD